MSAAKNRFLHRVEETRFGDAFRRRVGGISWDPSGARVSMPPQWLPLPHRPAPPPPPRRRPQQSSRRDQAAVPSESTAKKSTRQARPRREERTHTAGAGAGVRERQPTRPPWRMARRGPHRAACARRGAYMGEPRAGRAAGPWWAAGGPRPEARWLTGAAGAGAGGGDLGAVGGGTPGPELAGQGPPARPSQGCPRAQPDGMLGRSRERA